MWQGIPGSYRKKQVYTDEYVVYESLVPWYRHCIHACMNWQCPKGSGDTNVVEGTNNRLRQRVSYFCRKTGSFARKTEWLSRRLLWTVYHTNLEIKKAFLKNRTNQANLVTT